MVQLLKGHDKFPHLFLKALNKKQQEFLKLRTRTRAFFAGNWGGKTFLAAQLWVNACAETKNPLFAGYDFPKPPFKGRIIATSENITQTIIPLLEEWLPKGSYKNMNKGHTYPYFWEMNTGTQFTLMTNDQDPKQFAGPDLQMQWIDEPISREIYAETIGRHKNGGFILLSLTPLGSGCTWMLDEIVNRADSKRNSYIIAAIWDNCKDNGGFLEREFIENYLSTLTPQEREAREFGKFASQIGAIYKNFSHNTNVVEAFDIPKHWTRYLACDPHDDKPFALVWAAVNPMNDIFIYKEFPERDFWKSNSNIISQVATLIWQEENENPTRAKIIDKYKGGCKNALTGLTLIDEFARHKIYFETLKESSVNVGHLMVREALGDENKKPRLFVFNSCVNTIKFLQYYSYDTEKYKDFADCVRYLITYGSRFISPDMLDEGVYAHNNFEEWLKKREWRKRQQQENWETM